MKIWTTVLALLISHQVSAQKSVVLTNSATQEVIIIEEGTKIKFWDTNGRKAKGEFVFVAEGLLILDKSKILEEGIKAEYLDSNNLLEILKNGIDIGKHSYGPDELFILGDTLILPKKYLYQMDEFAAMKIFGPKFNKGKITGGIVILAVGIPVGFIVGIVIAYTMAPTIVAILPTAAVIAGAILIIQPKKRLAQDWEISDIITSGINNMQ